MELREQIYKEASPNPKASYECKALFIQIDVEALADANRILRYSEIVSDSLGLDTLCNHE